MQKDYARARLYGPWPLCKPQLLPKSVRHQDPSRRWIMKNLVVHGSPVATSFCRFQLEG